MREGHGPPEADRRLNASKEDQQEGWGEPEP